MTRHELCEILEVPFLKRYEQGLQIFKWEHCAKSFLNIPNDLAMSHLMQMSKNICTQNDEQMILKCECNSETYYFGVDLEDCDSMSTQKMRELYNSGTWYVYTWSD